jgi:tRNA nucleotidyltransferase (CCA-adding enzyme)
MILRRDFTINAIAVCINSKAWDKVVDPFGGIQDLKAKRIRILHGKSFLDDPTRIVRAARFKSRLGFSIERVTLSRLKQAVAQGCLDTIRLQRYLKEFNKILKDEHSRQAIQCLKAWGAYKGADDAYR